MGELEQAMAMAAEFAKQQAESGPTPEPAENKDEEDDKK